jgi:hypothetical protein
MAQLGELHQHGYRVVVEADLKGFFDSIPHPLILGLVAREIADGNIVNLIQKFLQAGVMEEGEVRPTRKGTPQGGVVSPLLANIVRAPVRAQRYCVFDDTVNRWGFTSSLWRGMEPSAMLWSAPRGQREPCAGRRPARGGRADGIRRVSRLVAKTRRDNGNTPGAADRRCGRR